MAQHGNQIGARDRLVIRVWRAWALLQADKAADALKAFNLCLRDGQAILADDEPLRTEVQLGQAEALAGRGRFLEALPVFAEVWNRTAEESPQWWRAFVGQLDCHARLERDADQIRQSIQQRRYLSSDLGGPRWKRRIEAIEASLETR